jgi:hypothetical protein
MIPLLFQLPHAWLVAFLSEWLDIPSIGKLDTTICSKAYRPQFLGSLQTMRSTRVDKFSANGKKVDRAGRWLRWLSLRNIYIERIFVHGAQKLSNLAIFTIPSVRTLETFECSDDEIHYLVRCCPALRSLDISSSYRKTNENERRLAGELITEHGLGSIANYCQHLEVLSYSRRSSCHEYGESYYTRTAAALIDVLRQCSNLKKVSLSGDSVRSVVPDALLPYGHLFHDLPFSCDQHDANSASTFIRKCVNLRKVSCTLTGLVTDRLVIAALCQACPLLEELGLSAGMHLNPPLLENLLVDIRANCVNLRCLSLFCCGASDSSLRIVSCMESLKEFRLTDLTHRDTDTGGVTDVGIAELAKMRLVDLSITMSSEWSGVSEAALQSFVGANISQTLESISIQGHLMDPDRMIDDVRVATALASCPRLSYVSVDWLVDKCVFGRHSLEGLQAMAAGCPLLSNLSLNVTPRGMKYLGTHCSNLRLCFSTYKFDEGKEGKSVDEELQELKKSFPKVYWHLRGKEI